MSRLEEIQERLANLNGYNRLNEITFMPLLQELINESMRVYAKGCVEASLEKASKQLFGFFIDEDTEILVRDANKYCNSITNPENIVLL